METVRECGCKGIRSCLICEAEYKIVKPDLKAVLQKQQSYVYCPECNKCWPGWDRDSYKEHPNHSGTPVDFPGVYIKLDFLSKEEAEMLLKALDNLPWEVSQSGRRKQNFGPKCNFKKRKLRVGNFNGFPLDTGFVQEKFRTERTLRDFQTIEQCTLEYDPNRGASIDPHIDDCWIWGERIVTVNVLGDSVLTMTPYRGTTEKYNLQDLRDYAPKDYQRLFESSFDQDPIVEPVFRLPMPERSLMVLYGAARYKWEHCVLREDVESRRVCIAYREFTPPYLDGRSSKEEAEEILKRAKNFF